MSAIMMETGDSAGNGAIFIEIAGIEGAKIVDRVVVSVVPVAYSTSFYSPELVWEPRTSRWICAEAIVVPGRYEVSVDVEVGGDWLWEPDSTPLEVVAGRVTELSFRLEDKVRLDQRWLGQM